MRIMLVKSGHLMHLVVERAHLLKGLAVWLGFGGVQLSYWQV
jgi:hypothetical protein